MKGTRASIRYAKATLAFAQEAQAAQQVADDFKYGIKDCEIAEGPHDAEMIKTAIELASN